MSSLHSITDITNIFDTCFATSFNTRLVKGNDEPIYLPSGMTDIGIAAQEYNQVVFAHGYYASALHEIAHWCLAGEARRKKIDFGYWYCPDGRTAKQQAEFQQAEIKPQAIEWAFCVAAGFQFNVSCDNLTGDEFGQQPDAEAFRKTIFAQVKDYLETHFPPRAMTFINALASFYGNKTRLCLSDFQQNHESLQQSTKPICN